MPVDMSHFKNILHHRILLNSVKPHKGSSRCRCCHAHLENTDHLVTCRVIRRIWIKFNRLVAATHRTSRISPALVFHAVDSEGRMLPPALSSLHLILWKFTIYNLTTNQTEGARFSPTNIWTNTIRRFETRVNALAFKVKRHAIMQSGRSEMIIKPNAENKRLRPLASLDPWGKITYHPIMQEAIKLAHPVPDSNQCASGAPGPDR